MPLQAGSQLGPYRILGALGAGGMGEVYRAQDTRLGRDVALKVLPEALTSTYEARARFELEARAIASLNHPHICTIHDTGREGDTSYLVLELVEGRSLRDALASGPLPIDTILALGIDMADALEAAHAKGIVHRDLKPGNIMVTPRGAKVMDFGVAAVSRAAAVAASGETVTGSDSRITSTGTTVGSVAYMSPEQARGEAVDARSDLFSLGTVLYEMATSELPFAGATSAVIFDGILNRPPAPLRARRPEVPAELERIVSKALEKDRDLRYQTAAELRADLRRLKRDRDSAKEAAAPAAPDASSGSSWRRWAKWPAFAMALVVAAAGIWWIAGRSRTGPADQGTWIPRQIPFTGRRIEAGMVALSPDGTTVAALSESTLSVLSIETSDLRVVDRLASGEGTFTSVDWSADGLGLVATRRDRAGDVTVVLVDLITGRRTALTGLGRLGADEAASLVPTLSPNGAWVAFRRGYGTVTGEFRQLWIKNVQTGAEQLLVRGAADEAVLPPVWAPGSDRLAFVHGRGRHTLAPLRTSLETCDLRGNTTTVVADSAGGLESLEGPDPTLRWLNDGRILYAWHPSRYGVRSDAELYSIRVDPKTGRPSGRQQLLFALPGGSLRAPTVSKDGRRVLVVAIRDAESLRFSGVDGRARYEELASGASTSQLFGPIWSRDGRGIFVRSNAASSQGVIGYLRLADGAFERMLTLESPKDRPLSLTPDGQELLCFLGPRLVAVPVGGGSPRPLGPRFDGGVYCAPKGGRCIATERFGDTLVVRDFSPVAGRGSVRFRYPLGGLDTRIQVAAALSPDGSRLAVLRGGPSGCSILDASTGAELSRIQLPPGSLAQDVVWSPDGAVLYASGMNGAVAFWIARLAERRLDRLIWTSDNVWPGSPVVSPDGSTIAFISRHLENEVWVIQRQ